MDTPRDRITLTSEERQILAVLEHRAGCDDPKLKLALTAGSRATRLHSRRVVDIAAVLLFLAGVSLMLATFARWPILGIAAVVGQAIALWVICSRWAPGLRAQVQRWTHDLRAPGSVERPGRR